MRKIIYTLLGLIIELTCYGQVGEIHGHINFEGENGRFEFISIALNNQFTFLNSNFIISPSDSLGNFDFNQIPVGLYDLTIRYGNNQDTTITNIYVGKISEQSLLIDYRIWCRFDLSQHNDKCPICRNNDKVKPITYGDPTHKTLKKAIKGKIELGGCISTGCDPH